MRSTTLFRSITGKITCSYNKCKSRSQSAILSRYWQKRRKKISAMVRVRNGAQFLEQSVLSIAPAVDEVVIIDNNSTDNTPEIIKKLQVQLNNVLLFRSISYEHNVAKVGEEHAEIFHDNPNDPRLTHVFYNWCMNSCSSPFIIKWDDDMIATKGLVTEISMFRRSSFLQMNFGGTNIAPNKVSELSWRAGSEPRIFPKYGSKFLYCTYNFTKNGALENFGGQSLQSWVAERYHITSNGPRYAHLKYLKSDPGSNQSPKFRADIDSKCIVSEQLQPEMLDLLNFISD